MFQRYFSDDHGIFQDIVDGQMDPFASWHDAISVREDRDSTFSLGNRAVICPFRRLPPWLESRYSFEYNRSPQLNHRPELLLEGRFLEQDGSENHADVYAEIYLPESILKSGNLRFIRVENFESDFKSAFADHIDVSIIPDWEFSLRENTSTSELPLEIRQKLYDHQPALYEDCPYWKMVEDLAYGSTP